MADEIKETKSSGGGKWAFLFAAIVFGLVVALFFNNAQAVEVDLLFKKVPININLLIIICFLLGLIFGVFLMIPSLYRAYKTRRKLTKEIKDMVKQEEVRVKDNFTA